MTRSYSREDWNTAQLDWSERDFGPEWKLFRHEAAMRGILFAPSGDKYDSWDDDEPSQRALLFRAIRDTPVLLREAIDRSRTWGEVIAYVLRRRDEWRDELAERDREEARRRAEIEVGPRGATMSIKAILDRIGDS